MFVKGGSIQIFFNQNEIAEKVNFFTILICYVVCKKLFK